MLTGQHTSTIEETTDSLFLTIFIITALPVDEQDRKVHNIEVCNWRIEPGGKRPCKCHQQVAAARHESNLKNTGGKKEELTSSWDVLIDPTILK